MASPAAQAPRGMLALVFTDVQGSTALWDRAPDAMRQSIRVHDEIVRAALAAHHGYEVRTEGDAFKVAFGAPLQALRFCCEVQEALLGADWPDALLTCADAAEVHAGDRSLLRGLRVRMGAHLGQPEVLVHPTTGRVEYDGPVVNTTARISALPAGGQVVVSRVLWDAARLDVRELDLVDEDLGRHRLKGLEAPIPLVQVMPPALAARRFPALRSRLSAESNLGPRDDLFVGRDTDLARVTGLLDGDARLVTLVGPGGSGKTRLAVEVGHAQLGSGRSGVWFCDLTATGDEAEVAQAVATALRVPLPAGASAREARGHVGGMLASIGAALLVLDNAEQALAATRNCVGAWRAAAPDCRFLVTTREPLGAPGEQLVEVASLSGPAGIHLFVERARRARPDFDPGEERDAIGAIVEKLDGLPLAIELAAARVDVLGPRAIDSRLSQRFRLLSRGSEARGARATLRGTLDHSWDLLTPTEQAALAQCAVFAGGFTIEDAEGVLALGDDAWPMDVVQDLRRKSLLHTRSDGAEVRLGLYETVRVYAAEKLDLAGLREPTERRHAAWFAEAGGRWLRGLDGADELRASDRLRYAEANLRAVWERECGRDPGRALQAFAALGRFLTLDPPVGVIETLDDAVALARVHGDPALLAAILLVRADMRRVLTQPEASVADCREAVALLEGGEPRQRVAAMRELMLSLLHLSDGPAEALAVHDRALRLVDEQRDPLSVSKIVEIGAWAFRSSEPDEAIARHERALALAERSGAQLHVASCQSSLGVTLVLAGRRDEGIPMVRAGGEARVKAGDRRGHVFRLFEVLRLAEEGRFDEADALQREVHRGLAPLPAPGVRASGRVGEGLIAVGRGKQALARGDADGARAAFAEARALIEMLRGLPAADGSGARLAEQSGMLRNFLELLEGVLGEHEAAVGVGGNLR